MISFSRNTHQHLSLVKFNYKNVTDYKDITIKQVPMLIHVENKKIDHVYYKASDIKKALD